MLRFSMVGVVNTGIDFAVFFALVYLAGLHVLAANVLAFAAAVSNSFLLNRRFTFSGLAPSHGTGSQFVRFIVTNLMALGLSSLMIWILTPFTGVVVTKVLATGVTLLWSYTCSYLFVFRGRKQRDY